MWEQEFITVINSLGGNNFLLVTFFIINLCHISQGRASTMKGGKATPGKAGKGATPRPDPPSETPTQNGPLSPQEVARKQRLLHMWKEHKAAIQHEGMKVWFKQSSMASHHSTWHAFIIDLASRNKAT